MNNFSLRYIHERGTFDCRYDRCIPFGIFALHFCKTRTFVTLGYDASSLCTEINTIFRALCTYQWPWPMQKSNLISSVLFFFFFFYICKVEGEPSSYLLQISYIFKLKYQALSLLYIYAEELGINTMDPMLNSQIRSRIFRLTTATSDAKASSATSPTTFVNWITALTRKARPEDFIHTMFRYYY